MLNNKQIRSETESFMRSLKKGNLAELYNSIPSRRHVLLAGLEERLEKAPTDMTKASKRARLVLKALITPINDIFSRLEDDDLMASEAKEYAEVLGTALDELDAWSVDDEETKRLEAGGEVKGVSLFTQSQTDAGLDMLILKRKGKFKKKARIMQVTRKVAAHFDMSITEYDIAQTSLPGFSITDAYTVIADQKVIVVDNSSLEKGTDQYALVSKWLKKNNEDQDLMVIDNPSYTQGLGYWWVISVDDYEVLFAEREINAWCPCS